MAGNERVVSLSVRGKDEFTKVLNQAVKGGLTSQRELFLKTKQQLAEYTASIAQTQRQLTALTKAEGDNRAAVGSLIIAKGKLIEAASRTSKELDRIKEAVRSNSTSATGSYSAFIKMANGMDVTAAKAARLKKELAEVQTAINRGKANQALADKVGTSFGAANARLTQDQIDRARQLKAQLRELEAVQGASSGAVKSNIRDWFRYTDTLQASQVAAKAATATEAAAVPALKAKKDAANAAALAVEKLTVAETRNMMSGSKGALPGARQRNQGLKGDKQEVELFGLKPWQLTNLGYQVNDVISGVAMGQNPVQILAQQAGQFAQIWPEVMVGLARTITILGPLAAAMTPVIVNMVRIKQESEAFETFRSELALSADGARYSAKELASMTMEVAKSSATFDQARGVISAFVKEGIDQANIEPLAKMAGQLSKITGEDLPAAAERLGKAFGGGLSTIQDLDKELNFLTADQYDHIKALFEAKKNTEALAEAQAILSERLADAQPAASDWEKATGDIGAAWEDLLATVADTGVVEIAMEGLTTLVGSLLGAVELIVGAVSGATELIAIAAAKVNALSGNNPQMRKAALETQIAAIKASIAEYKQYLSLLSPDDPLTDRYQNNVSQLEADLARAQAEYAGLVAEAEAAEDAAKKAADEAEVVTGESEKQKKAASDFNDLIDERIQKMQDEAAKVNDLTREQSIALEILEAQNEAREKGLELTGQQIAKLEEAAGKLFDLNEAANFGESFGTFADGASAAAALLSKFEGFRGTAYWDVNAWRTGFGSDTATRKDGSVETVTESTVVSLDDAIRDLTRRLADEFLPMAARAVGQERFAAFTPAQQAAVASIAYNYGEIPDRIVDALRTGTNEQIAEAIRSLGGDNQGVNRSRRNKEASLFEGGAVADATEAALEAEQDRLETAKEYNDSLAERITEQQFELEQLSKAGREAAIAKAIREEELKAKEAGVELSEAERAKIAEVTGALYDRQNVETEVNAIMERRSLLVDALSQAQEDGDQERVKQLVDEIRGTDTELAAAIDKAIAFWEAIGGPGADAAILKLQNLKNDMKDISTEMEKNVLPTAEQLNDRLSDVAGSGFTALAEALAKGENAAQAFFQAMIQSLGELLIEIGKAIVKQAILNALMGGQGSSGGAGGFLSKAIASIFHEGGIAGQPYAQRMVNPALFNGARRYHGGGMAGLAPGEVPIIAMRREEILTEDDPRHSSNGGGMVVVKNVNVFDPVDVLEQALATEPGERVQMNFMTRRSRAIKGIVG